MEKDNISPESDKTEEDVEQFSVPFSAIEHYSYCPRQCALIHDAPVFDENLFS